MVGMFLHFIWVSLAWVLVSAIVFEVFMAVTITVAIVKNGGDLSLRQFLVVIAILLIALAALHVFTGVI